jgi:hypothetical protein
MMERRRSLAQLMLPARAILNDFPAMLVFHLLPAFAFVASAQTADTQAGFIVELADVDTG